MSTCDRKNDDCGLRKKGPGLKPCAPSQKQNTDFSGRCEALPLSNKDRAFARWSHSCDEAVHEWGTRHPAISPNPRQPNPPLASASEQGFLLHDRLAERAEKPC